MNHFLQLTIASSTLLFLLSSCNSNSSSNSNQTAKNPNESILNTKARDMSIELPSMFTKQKDIDSFPKTIYTRGCKASGDRVADYGFDERLQVGHRLVRKFSTSGTEELETQTESIIRKSSKTKISYEQNILKFQSSSMKGITAVPYLSTPNRVVEEALEFYSDKNQQSRPKHNSVTLEDHLNPEFLQQWRNNRDLNNVRYSCRIDYSSSKDSTPESRDEVPSTAGNSHTSTYSLGTFRLENVNIPAWQYASNSSGEVVCEKEVLISSQNSADTSNTGSAPKPAPREEFRLGLGTQSVVVVRSNNVAADSWDFCGGHQVYTSILLKLSDGRIVQSFANRLDAAPVIR